MPVQETGTFLLVIILIQRGDIFISRCMHLQNVMYYGTQNVARSI